AHGVVWSTSGTPTIANDGTDEGTASATGAFASSMTGLSPNTTYYVRAYAINTAGTAYGDVTSFATSAQPSVRFSTSTYSLAENAGPKTITVTLSGTSSQNITVQYATSNGTAQSGSDYTAVSGTLTFTAGDSSKTFSIPVTNDSSIESNETVNLALANPVNAALGSPNTAVLTITNDDEEPPFTTPPSGGNSGGGTSSQPSSPPSPTPTVPPSTTPPIVSEDTGEDTVIEPPPQEETVTVEWILAEVDTSADPVATDSEGNALYVTGNLITVSETSGALTVNIPVALEEGSTLNSFTDAAGLTFKDNRLVIPAASAGPGGMALLSITDGTGDLGTHLTIETGDTIGRGEDAIAPVLAIKSDAGFATKDFTPQDPSLGEVASTLRLDLNTIPQNAEVRITISLEPDPAAGSAFQLAATESGMGDMEIAYTINIEKTNLENGTDIESAAIVMKVGVEWVEAHGGADAIRIFRYDPQTGEHQALDTRFVGYDADGRAIFEGISPDGLSVFGLAGRTGEVSPEGTPESIETPEPIAPTPPDTGEAISEKADGGDGTNWGLIMGLIVAAIASLIVAVIIRKRRKATSGPRLK
ncbi:MAG: hypothetical protein FJZ95_06430, partial [Chloroflexi bacterium]|nr:hypothetical protein [Chloroflexota bacterium]